MRLTLGGTIQGLARLKAHRDGSGAAEVDYFLQSRSGRSLGDQDAVKRSFGAQRFSNGMNTDKEGHRYQDNVRRLEAEDVSESSPFVVAFE
jgi:hypothetical protein